MKTAKKKTQSRWGKNAAGGRNLRYDKKQMDEIDKKFHEDPSWRNGAKVRRR